MNNESSHRCFTMHYWPHYINTICCCLFTDHLCSAEPDAVRLGAVNAHVCKKKERPPVECSRKCVTHELFTMHCHCEVQCTYKLRQRVPDIVTLIVEAREKLISLGHKQSPSFLFNELVVPLRQNPRLPGGKHVVNFVFAGVPICCELWCQLYGLKSTDSRIKKMLAQLRKGCSAWNCDDSEPKTGKGGWRGVLCRAWCRTHIKKFAEFDPTKLTAALDPNPVEVRHMIYKADWSARATGSRAGPPLKLSRFTDHWNAQMKDGYVEAGVKYEVKTRPPRSGFTCSICQILMDKRRNATSRTAREELSFQLKQHLQQVVSLIASNHIARSLLSHCCHLSY